MEFIILNLTDKIDKTQNTTNMALPIPISCCVLLVNPLCIVYSANTNIFKANNSTKSQLHQPPQESSCSAHQPPNNIEIKSMEAVANKSTLRRCVCTTLT